ncbi:MAG: hypothetical protein M3238_04820, partial [Actinomycetota bacterium]|nr:hypothetical protein [Actinomycetota bacterium]
MASRRWARIATGLLGVGVLLPLLAPAPLSTAQTAPECMQPGETTPEDFGPTDISAVSGNRKLSVAFNPAGTVTVLKWPSPSFYDQIKYRTVDRSEPLMGALPNEGAFLGIASRANTQEEWAFTWLRDLDVTQRFADDDTDEVVTTYTDAERGLTARLRDVVAHNRDVLVRRLSVTRSTTSPVRQVRVVSFANFNPVFSKNPQAPYSDWCREESNDDGGQYLE